MGPITHDDRSVIQAPSENEALPVGQHFPLALSPPFDSANSDFSPPKGDDRDGSMTTVQTPTHFGVDLEAPSPHRALASS